MTGRLMRCSGGTKNKNCGAVEDSTAPFRRRLQRSCTAGERGREAARGCARDGGGGCGCVWRGGEMMLMWIDA